MTATGGRIPGFEPRDGEVPVKLSDGIEYRVEYDPELGEVHEYWNSGISQIIQVRAGLLDKVTRIAAIAELERLGYTVIAPEEES